jgi:hypothetical protein
MRTCRVGPSAEPISSGVASRSPSTDWSQPTPMRIQHLQQRSQRRKENVLIIASREFLSLRAGARGACLFHMVHGKNLSLRWIQVLVGSTLGKFSQKHLSICVNASRQCGQGATVGRLPCHPLVCRQSSSAPDYTLSEPAELLRPLAHHRR